MPTLKSAVGVFCCLRSELIAMLSAGLETLCCGRVGCHCLTSCLLQAWCTSCQRGCNCRLYYAKSDDQEEVIFKKLGTKIKVAAPTQAPFPQPPVAWQAGTAQPTGCQVPNTALPQAGPQAEGAPMASRHHAPAAPHAVRPLPKDVPRVPSKVSCHFCTHVIMTWVSQCGQNAC